MAEKVYEDNQKLRSALVSITTKVKEFTNVVNANRPSNASFDTSQIEQYPIEDEDMEIEESQIAGLVGLLDDMIKQGEESVNGHLLPRSPVKPRNQRQQREERHDL